MGKSALVRATQTAPTKSISHPRHSTEKKRTAPTVSQKKQDGQTKKVSGQRTTRPTEAERVTMEALDEISCSDGEEMPPEDEWDEDAKALKKAIQAGAFDHLLKDAQKKKNHNHDDDEDDDDDSIEEVILGDDDDDDDDEDDDHEGEEEEEEEDDKEEEEEPEDMLEEDAGDDEEDVEEEDEDEYEEVVKRSRKNGQNAKEVEPVEKGALGPNSKKQLLQKEENKHVRGETESSRVKPSPGSRVLEETVDDNDDDDDDDGDDKDDHDDKEQDEGDQIDDDEEGEDEADNGDDALEEEQEQGDDNDDDEDQDEEEDDKPMHQPITNNHLASRSKILHNEGEEDHDDEQGEDDENDQDEDQGEDEEDRQEDDEGEDKEVEMSLQAKNKINAKALRVVVEDLARRKRGWDWVETLDIIPSTALPFANSSKDDNENVDVIDIHDDLKREVAFHDLALEAVTEARKRCRAASYPFSRPEDFFAEMVKTDEHMAKIKDRLIFENKKIEAVAQRKSNQELKLRAKESQSRKQAEKAQRKRDHMKAVESWAQSAAAQRGRPLADEDDAPFLSNNNNSQKKRQMTPNKKREAADKKYGFGGKRGRFKQHDPKVLNDFSSFNPRGNFGGIGSKKTAAKASPSPKGGKRMGKRARDAKRSTKK